MGSEQNRFPQQERSVYKNSSVSCHGNLPISLYQRKRWGGCWGALSCFHSQKGGKRIVPASRIPEGNAMTTQPNGPQAAGMTNQATVIAPSLLAPPSSPASFTNSALPSTAQSPSCFLSLSANSPGGPSSTMYATGPYAHETQLVSPPVFSTFTTEPSTAPLTPPPELAHLTTPSSPDVPFAQFLSSSVDLKRTQKTNYIASNDLQATYSLYPGSPASSLVSPISRASGDCLSSSFPERDFTSQWNPSASPQDGKYPRSGSGRLFGHEKNDTSLASQDSNFFCPATFAQFYLDNPPFPHTGGRLSVSKDSDAYSSGGNGYQNRHNKSPKHDVEEIEAYRASFGFSADEIITTTQYVEISDVMEDSFTMTPFTSTSLPAEGSIESPLLGEKLKSAQTTLRSQRSVKSASDVVQEGTCTEVPALGNGYEDNKLRRQPDNILGSNTSFNCIESEEDVFSKMGPSKNSRKYNLGLSCSDAEVDYRRGRSSREIKGGFSWHD